MCRWLADYTNNVKRKCSLHKKRAERVALLLPQIDKDKFPEAWGTVQLDIGNAYRGAADAKLEDGQDYKKARSLSSADTTFPVTQIGVQLTAQGIFSGLRVQL